MYKLTEFETIIRTIDGANIPKDTGNRDYREYLEWLENGNTPFPAYTEEEILERQKNNRIIELRKLLSDSDFRMTTDYYKRMTPEDQTYWDTTRESWRSELRELLGE